jgi:tetratricopeptide (TPR) repeat protein
MRIFITKYLNNSIKILLLFILTSLILISCGSKEVKKSKEYIQAGMYSEAIELLKLEVQQNPKNAEAQYLLGYVHLLIDQDNRSNEFFHRAELLDKKYLKKRPRAYFDAACQLLNQETRLAIYYFEKATEKNNDLKKESAKICFDQAKELFKENKGFYHGLELLQKSLQFDPTLLSSISSYCLKMANMEYENRNFEKSITLLETATDPSILSKKNPLLINIGFEQWKAGNSSFSKRCLNAAKENGANFESSDSLFFAYHIDLESSNLNDDNLLKFLKLFPKSDFCPEILFKRAKIYFFKTNLVKSKKIFTEILNQYPNSTFGKKAKSRISIWPDAAVYVSSSSNFINIGLPVFSPKTFTIFENHGNERIELEFYSESKKVGMSEIAPKSALYLTHFNKIVKVEAKLKNSNSNCFLVSYLKNKDKHWPGKKYKVTSTNWIDSRYRPTSGKALIIENRGKSEVEIKSKTKYFWSSTPEINDRLFSIKVDDHGGYNFLGKADYLENVKFKLKETGTPTELIFIELPLEL